MRSRSSCSTAGSVYQSHGSVLTSTALIDAQASGGSGRSADELVVEPREVDRTRGAEVLDDRLLVVQAREQRLPAEEMAWLVEVAGRDRRKPGVGDPAEELPPVEELEAMGEVAEPGVAREALREAPSLLAGSSAFGCAATIAAPASAAVLMASAIPSSTATNSRSPTARACAAITGSSSLKVSSRPGITSIPYVLQARSASRSTSARYSGKLSSSTELNRSPSS